MGLRADAEYVTSLLRVERGTSDSSSSLDSSWGKVLTDSEAAELRRRETVGFAAQDLLSTVNSTPDLRASFGTLWQDHLDGGRIHVSLLGTDPGVQDAIRQAFAFPEQLVFEQATVSRYEIERTYDRLVGFLERLSVLNDVTVPAEAVAVDEIAGTIRVSLPSLSLEPVLREAFPESFIRFEEGTVGPSVRQRRVLRNPLLAGLAVYPNGAANVAFCTTGFGIYRSRPSGSEHYFLTSGHCENLAANGTVWRQGGRNVNPIQFVGVSGQSDEAVIRVPQGLESSRVYISSTSFPITYRVQQKSQDFVGQSICISLGARDTIDCGTIANRFGAITDAEGTTTNQRVVNNVATVGGDSGSPVYGGAGGSQQIAYGIHTGQCDGTPCFSHIEAATLELSSGFGSGFAVIRNY